MGQSVGQIENRDGAAESADALLEGMAGSGVVQRVDQESDVRSDVLDGEADPRQQPDQPDAGVAAEVSFLFVDGVASPEGAAPAVEGGVARGVVRIKSPPGRTAA